MNIYSYFNFESILEKIYACFHLSSNFLVQKNKIKKVVKYSITITKK